MQPCQKTITSCEPATEEVALTLAVKMHRCAKAHQLSMFIAKPTAKKQALLRNKQENHTNYRKKFILSKEKTFEQFMEIPVDDGIKLAKPGIFEQKTPKLTHSWSIQFWSSIANVSATQQHENTST